MSGIAAFVLARIDEDEAIARAGISGQEDPENGWGYEGRALTPHVGIIHEAAQAAHVTRWHPARVLAECAAKRAIVDAAWEDSVMLDVEYHLRGRERLEADGDYPDTLRHLASIYADHPDYDPAWAPRRTGHGQGAPPQPYDDDTL